MHEAYARVKSDKTGNTSEGFRSAPASVDSRLQALHRSDPEPLPQDFHCLFTRKLFTASSTQNTTPSWLLRLCCRNMQGRSVCEGADSYCRDAPTEKSKELDCHPWMGHWLPEYMQSSSGQRGRRKEIWSEAQPCTRSFLTASPSSLLLPCVMNSHAAVPDQMPKPPVASGPCPCLGCPKGCLEVPSEHSRGRKAD